MNYNDINDEQKGGFFEEAMILGDVSLEFEDFDKFSEARKRVLASKIRELLG